MSLQEVVVSKGCSAPFDIADEVAALQVSDFMVRVKSLFL